MITITGWWGPPKVYRDYVGLYGGCTRRMVPIMENQMENEMEATTLMGSYSVVFYKVVS